MQKTIAKIGLVICVASLILISIPQFLKLRSKAIAKTHTTKQTEAETLKELAKDLAKLDKDIKEDSKLIQGHKVDVCRQYQEIAMEYLPAAPKNGRFNESINVLDTKASVSAAYSSYYLVCRDLERRESE